MDFAEVALRYRLIEKDAINVLITYPERADDCRSLRDELDRDGLTGKWLRKAQPYVVSLYRPRSDSVIWQWLAPAPIGRAPTGRRAGVSDDWYVYLDPRHYHPKLGLVPPDEPDVLIG